MTFIYMESSVSTQSQEAELETGQLSSLSALKHLEQINKSKMDLHRFGTSKENKKSAGWEVDARLTGILLM